MPYDWSRQREALKRIKEWLDEVYGRAWVLGGGTALSAFFYAHRFSEDLDLFLRAERPFLRQQLAKKDSLEKLSQKIPVIRSFFFGHYLELIVESRGQLIKVQVMEPYPYFEEAKEIRRDWGFELTVEAPLEIVAKKLFWKTSSFRPRDILDIAVSVTHRPQDLISILTHPQLGSGPVLEFLKNLGERLHDSDFLNLWNEEMDFLEINPEYEEFKNIFRCFEIIRGCLKDYLIKLEHHPDSNLE